MELKACACRTSNVAGLYGDDLVIVKPGCFNHESVFPGRRSESLDSYGASPWRSPFVWTLNSSVLSLAQADNSLLRCQCKQGI